MKAPLASALALLGACTVETRLLDNPHMIVTSCDEAWEQGSAGAPCVLARPCARPSPEERMCCTDTASCRGGELWLQRSCLPQCDCQDDGMCEFALAICIDHRCQPCPPPELCAPCPQGWVRLTRNGCETCQCGPHSECDSPGEPCREREPMGEAGVCYPGASCADGCAAEQPGCCSNVCSREGCPSPAPIGCYTDCPPNIPCALCATHSCECDGATWMCAPICADNASFTCTHP